MTVPVYRHCPCNPSGNGAPTWHSALALATGVIRLRCDSCGRLADVNTSTDVNPDSERESASGLTLLEEDLLAMEWTPECLVDQNGNAFTRWHPPVGGVRRRPDLGPPMLDV